MDAIKVATWWNDGAAGLARRRCGAGIPAYFVQDIETSLLRRRPGIHGAVLADLPAGVPRHDDLGVDATGCASSASSRRRVPPGLDLDRFRPLGASAPDGGCSRSAAQPAEELPAHRRRVRAPGRPRPELWLFGIEPELGEPLDGARYFERPSDAEVNELLNTATVFVQTSRHEGFCLPVLEAMATGVPVVARTRTATATSAATGRTA